jgi:ElaA protein
MSRTLYIKPYRELSLDEFHDIIALRVAIFVVEQDCPYQELDGLDKEAWHLIVRDEKETMATLRILPRGTSYSEWSIGRVVVSESARGTGLGHEIMDKAITFVQEKESEAAIKISAQTHLKEFYAVHGFEQCGEGYLEDDIPHIPMQRT